MSIAGIHAYKMIQPLSFMKTKITPVFFQATLLIYFLFMPSACSFVSHPSTDNQQQGEIKDWDPKIYSHFGIKHAVYESIHNNKDKPAIILLHQLPGLSKETLDYAETLTPSFSVYVPLLFGNVNMNNLIYGFFLYLFSPEWHSGENKPIHKWVRQLTVDIEKKHPGKHMGVIGMCLTGALPLALLENTAINSIVVSQPSLPLISFNHSSRASLDLSAHEYSIAKQRTLSGQVKILGLRFQQDSLAAREKLTTLKTDFSTAYIDLEICKDDYEKNNIQQRAHSVLIDEWSENLESTNPIKIRRQQVLLFFNKRLLKQNIPLPEARSCNTGNDLK